MPRVLLLLSQAPQDPTSGAARSMRTICGYLAMGGMEVRGLGTTATESAIGGATGGTAVNFDIKRYIQSAGLVPEFDRGMLMFREGAVAYSLLDTGSSPIGAWEATHSARFEALLTRELETFRPDIVFTYGGSPAERRRRRMVRAAGCKVVFGLRNLGYLKPGAFEDVDAVLTGSRFVTERYRAVLGLESTPLPLPLDWEEVVAPRQERVFVTYINPSVEKGVFFAARLFEELSVRRPDVPVLVVESRASAGALVAAGLTGGFDLRRHENLMVSGPVARPAEIYAVARVVVMPSVWEEPAGRVAAESLANGVPVLVSDRGGLPEVCAAGGGGGTVLRLPAELTVETRVPVAAAAVEEWLEALLRLVDDEAFYAEASARAAAAGQAYRPERLAERYVAFFRQVLDGVSDGGGRSPGIPGL